MNFRSLFISFKAFAVWSFVVDRILPLNVSLIDHFRQDKKFFLFLHHGMPLDISKSAAEVRSRSPPGEIFLVLRS